MPRAIFASEKGPVRDTNEDAYGSTDDLFVLCDGLGGQAAGEVAAKLAVKIILRSWKDQKTKNPLGRLRNAIDEANTEIWKEAQQDPDKRGMGTTIVALAFGDDDVAIAWVGDSRAYRFDDEEFEQLTQDHRVGLTMLANALGVSPSVYVQTVTLPRRKTDRFLLTTDGLTDTVPQETMARLVLIETSPKVLAQSLIDEALELGAPDNVTVGVISQ